MATKTTNPEMKCPECGAEMELFLDGPCSSCACPICGHAEFEDDPPARQYGDGR